MKTICSDETLKERFFKKVIKSDDQNKCWDWIGATYKFGYGCIGTSIGLDSVHRVSYRLHIGEIPNDLCVLHKCDNPKCSNPNHLFLGTKKDNAIDRNLKGRGKNPVHKGNHPMAKLSVDQVKEIKKSSLSMNELSEKYGASINMIRRILNGSRWGWV